MDPDDVRHAAQWLANELRARPTEDYDYDQPAHGLEWTCWYTLEHALDDLLAFALQVAGHVQDDYLPLMAADGSDGITRVDRGAGVAGMAASLEAMAELMAAQVQLQPGTARAYHPYGDSDPRGFAAMSVLEVIVHGWDVLSALDDEVADLPEDLCEGVLARLFPGSPDAGSPQEVLLWQTGRAELAGHGRLSSWRWDAAVR
ncbi:DinB family protein [Georgenia subflava]|uniref:Mycothiol-dependent maleylpyruvate isomerase metal-binding domain-containing protein n=1 Tax=Georgenia subflava TaxID=1622177 RepID=A0A6N7EMA1_9MICO|nr:hypothetical protein [Georgenia subflava]MPV38258.1 hypothetical protein [Georgenia subflava]